MPQSSSVPQSTTDRRWGFSSAGRVFYGWGVLEELRNLSQELGKRVMICTDRNIVKSGIADRVEALLKDGGCEVLVFPEGRRTPDGQLHPFMTGTGLLAANLRAPVVPIRLDGLFDLKQRGRHTARRGEVSVHIGQPLQFAADADPAQITRELERRVAAL